MLAGNLLNPTSDSRTLRPLQRCCTVTCYTFLTIGVWHVLLYFWTSPPPEHHVHKGITPDLTAPSYGLPLRQLSEVYAVECAPLEDKTRSSVGGVVCLPFVRKLWQPHHFAPAAMSTLRLCAVQLLPLVNWSCSCSPCGKESG